MSDTLSSAIATLRHEEALAMVNARIAQGEDALAILAACRDGMTLVGERFQQGDYYLSELLLAAEIFKEAAATLEPQLARTRSPAPRGRVVLATMRGDIHDLGKNIVATLLRAHAFDVHDLGVNTEPAAVVAAVETVQPDFVGFSALLTTAFDSMKAAADLLREAGWRHRLKLMIGGGVTTPQVKAHVGADFQTTDATAGIEYCMAVRKERRDER
ncbi:MAG: cobalamin-dependent protein [Candidatus Binatia bacterium]